MKAVLANVPSAEAALDFCMKAIEAAGFRPGVDVGIGLDCAATEFFKEGNYVYEGEGKTRSSEEQAKYLAKLATDYPILSIEDGMPEDDWAGWKTLTDLIGNRRQLVGDDCSSPTSSASATASPGHRQLDPGQGQPDRHRSPKPSPPSIWRSAPATAR